MAVRSIRVRVGERWYTVEVEDLSTSPVRVTVEGETFYVEVEGLPKARPARRVPPAATGPRTEHAQARSPGATGSDKIIRSPMPGRVMAVTVRPGDIVTPGQEVCVLEAMKMEQSIRTPQDGVVREVHVRPMDQVGTNDPLVELE